MVKAGKKVNAMTAQQLQGLAGKVYSPKRAKKYSEISAAVETWEMDVRLFEKAEGKTINDQTRLYAIRQIVPEDLEKDIVKSNSLNTFEDVMKYITEQTVICREACSDRTGGDGDRQPPEDGHGRDAGRKSAAG